MSKRFGIIRNNPINKLKKQYSKLVKKAEDFKKLGDILSYDRLLEEADILLKKIHQYQSLIN